jgi:serine/threonine-protein kinase
MAMVLALHDKGTVAAQAERRLLERAVAGRYRVMDLVSRGGMGAVYRGWDHGLERAVAIKLLAPARARDTDERGRFRREARILAALTHRNIVPVLATGESGDACWFAMPHFGGTLAERIAREPRLSCGVVRPLLIALADALAFAHERGVVHRDLKAENILLDEAARPVISDFGVAILRTSDHSRAEITKGYGTAAYMAPEQLRGALESDGRVDLYALGVLGFRMLTGRFPIEGSDERIVAAHTTLSEVPQVTAHAADVDRDLAAAIDRCLQRRPADRWADGAELRDALRTRSARPTGRLSRFIRRAMH